MPPRRFEISLLTRCAGTLLVFCAGRVCDAQISPAAGTDVTAALQQAGQGDPTAAAAAATEASAINVNVYRNHGSLADFLGLDPRRARAGVRRMFASVPLLRIAHQTVLAPIGQLTGLSAGPPLPVTPPGVSPGPEAAGGGPGSAPPPGGASAPPPQPPEAPELARKLAAQPQKVKEQVAAMRFLADQDCLLYPEIVDALLAALDDPAEVVRYEALRALRKSCRQTCGCYPGCASCQCQDKVLLRLSSLLLDKNANGCRRERSLRVRRLACLMLHECLSTRPIAAEDDGPGSGHGSGARPDPSDAPPAEANL